MQNEAETKKATRQAEPKKKLNKATSQAKLKQKKKQKKTKEEGKWKLKNGSDVCALLTMDMLKSRPRLPHQRQSQS